jgi:hypothetical protein
MTLGEIYIYINAMIAKEVEGNTFNPATFNAVIKEVDLESFKTEFDMLEQQAKAQGMPLYQLLFSGSPLRDFTESYTGYAPGGDMLLSFFTPSLEYLLACVAIYQSLYVDVEIVDIKEALYRKSKLDGMSLYEQPIISVYKDRLRILPTNMASVAGSPMEVIYLRLPVAPFYDYYIDNTTGKAYYFKPGYFATYVAEDQYAISNENSIPVVGAGNVTVPNNETEATLYYSKSTEFEWKDSYHPELIKKILRKAGLPLRDDFIVKTADA